LQALATVNEWPGDWMYYDTAISTQIYILGKVVNLIRSFLFDIFLLTISFMAAESLSRKAFPNHIQFWSIFSTGAANSKQVIGRTVSGYLLVGLDFAFLIGLYFFTTKILGWWTPSDVLIDPDILATYQPWFSPIAESIQAGFWEESLCRAIPIAGAALIGQKLGNRRVWIAGALLFQAILFGALHTDYAGQPSYARLVELIIPSLVYGLIYLRFGLLPCMILHFVFDAPRRQLQITTDDNYKCTFFIATPPYRATGRGRE
jgi:membrane protease YdiL (CAAX protease family)